MKIKRQKINQLFWLKIENGADLLNSLTAYCLDNKIRAGLILTIGALKNVNLNFYEQNKKKYLTKKINRPLEIVSCLGNVSLKDDRPFIHAHIAVADKNGRVFGGHLAPGSVVFAGECAILKVNGEPPRRKLDKLTNLNLWDFGKGK